MQLQSLQSGGCRQELSKLATVQSMDPQDIISIFNLCFEHSHNTVLQHADGPDPLYVPAAGASPARVQFAHGFFSSALHEVSHWCIAGEQRRLLPDYGYWYKPSNRTPEEQRAFCVFEAKNQGLEWIFSSAAGMEFHVSLDNLAESRPASLRFAEQVASAARRFITDGLPPRGCAFLRAVTLYYSTGEVFDKFKRNLLQPDFLPEF